MLPSLAMPRSTSVRDSGLMSNSDLLKVFVTRRLPPVSGEEARSWLTPGPFHLCTALSSSSVIPISWGKVFY